MIASRKRQTQRTAGTMVETAVVSLACFVFMFAIFEFGRVIMMRNLMENAARSGARIAVVMDVDAPNALTPTQQVTNVVIAALAGQNLQNVTVTIYQSDSSGNSIGLWTSAPFGQNILVQVDADYSYIFPSLGWLPNSGAAPNSVHLTVKAMMRGEAN